MYLTLTIASYAYSVGITIHAGNTLRDTWMEHPNNISLGPLRRLLAKRKSILIIYAKLPVLDPCPTYVTTYVTTYVPSYTLDKSYRSLWNLSWAIKISSGCDWITSIQLFIISRAGLSVR